MRSKGKLLALVAIFAAVALVTGTGAFSTVEAERTADVNVAGDSSALLGLEPAGNGYLIQNQNGEIAITLADNSNADGVNRNATTHVDQTDFLNVTNNGADDVELGIEATTPTDVEVYFVVSKGAVTGSTTDLSTNLSSKTFDETEKYPIRSNTVQISAGNTVSVGIVIDVGDVSPSSIISGDVTITAEEV
jgi:ABC-type antimicrobial peptide transport system permease subunit